MLEQMMMLFLLLLEIKPSHIQNGKVIHSILLELMMMPFIRDEYIYSSISSSSIILKYYFAYKKLHLGQIQAMQPYVSSEESHVMPSIGQ